MKLIRVAAAVLNQTPLDWAGNQSRIRQALAEARAQDASVVCLPELCITGYGCEDAFHSAGLQSKALDILAELVPETEGLVVTFGLPFLFQNALFNVVCVVAHGRILGFVAKRFLAGDGIHYEPRWFKPWPQQVRAIVEVLGHLYPIGDIFFQIGDIRIGLEICEDAWVAARPGATLALQGVDLILNPSASHFAFDKIKIRERFVLEGSRAFNASYVYSNLIGNESGRAIFDGGALIASGGTMLARGPRFSYLNVEVTTALIDVSRTRMNQARTASYRPDISNHPNEPIHVEFAWPSLDRHPEPVHRGSDPWETSPTLKEEEFTRAVTLGLFDYLRKSRSQGFVVSLSGGADSTAVCVLVALSLQLAFAELGVEGLKIKLSFISGIDSLQDSSDFVHRLLTCVYQASSNSSSTTRDAARQVATALKATFHEFHISRLVADYTEVVEQGLGRKLNWQTDDIALQNIQARVRSPGIWMVANLKNALLLSTSNRSEAAVGYATMDGDTSGGLSPIAGIDKAFLRQWLRWMETTGPYGIGNLPALAAVTKQAPTAELRPPQQKQTDEDDLMPYPMLDAIEKAAIRDKQTPIEVFARMQTEFPEEDVTKLSLWIDRFFRLWCRNQWKRERYAPSFHLDDENLDPKTWCRFPILSGGFEVELEELAKLARISHTSGCKIENRLERESIRRDEVS